MRLLHYYHVYQADGWERIVNEHINALESSGLFEFVQQVRLGVVGDDADLALDMFLSRGIRASLVAKADDGWEQVTLKALYDGLEDDTLILYAHTKGVANPSALNDAWRQSMTDQLVGNWQNCVRLLEVRGCEAVGCHWLTPEALSWANVKSPYFAGNFWWAKSELLRRCGEPLTETRYEAEAWLGLGEPKLVADRAPGWPGFDTFR